VLVAAAVEDVARDRLAGAVKWAVGVVGGVAFDCATVVVAVLVEARDVGRTRALGGRARDGEAELLALRKLARRLVRTRTRWQAAVRALEAAFGDLASGHGRDWPAAARQREATAGKDG